MPCSTPRFFFFQAEDGIRDIGVTGVQTCALPISPENTCSSLERSNASTSGCFASATTIGGATNERVMPYSSCMRKNCSRSNRGIVMIRSEERRVGKEGKWRGWRDHGREQGKRGGA